MGRPEEIARFTQSQIVTVPATTPGPITTEGTFIDYRKAAGGTFEIDDADLTTITWYTCSGAAGATVVAAQDDAGAAVTQTVADNKSYPIPAELFGAAYLYPAGNAAGTIRVDVKG